MFSFAIGLVGMIFILVAFVLDEFYRRFRPDTVQYNLLNIIGSGCLIIYAYSLKGWPFLMLNAVWFIVAVYKTIKIVGKRKK